MNSYVDLYIKKLKRKGKLNFNNNNNYLNLDYYFSETNSNNYNTNQNFYLKNNIKNDNINNNNYYTNNNIIKNNKSGSNLLISSLSSKYIETDFNRKINHNIPFNSKNNNINMINNNENDDKNRKDMEYIKTDNKINNKNNINIINDIDNNDILLEKTKSINFKNNLIETNHKSYINNKTETNMKSNIKTDVLYGLNLIFLHHAFYSFSSNEYLLNFESFLKIAKKIREIVDIKISLKAFDFILTNNNYKHINFINFNQFCGVLIKISEEKYKNIYEKNKKKCVHLFINDLFRVFKNIVSDDENEINCCEKGGLNNNDYNDNNNNFYEINNNIKNNKYNKYKEYNNNLNFIKNNHRFNTHVYYNRYNKYNICNTSNIQEIPLLSLISIIPTSEQLLIINSILTTLTHIYMFYFESEIDTSNLAKIIIISSSNLRNLHEKSRKDLLNFSKNFNICPYIISKENICRYFELVINSDNTFFCFENKKNLGFLFTLNHFCKFIIHMAEKMYEKNSEEYRDIFMKNNMNKKYENNYNKNDNIDENEYDDFYENNEYKKYKENKDDESSEKMLIFLNILQCSEGMKRFCEGKKKFKIKKSGSISKFKNICYTNSNYMNDDDIFNNIMNSDNNKSNYNLKSNSQNKIDINDTDNYIRYSLIPDRDIFMELGELNSKNGFGNGEKKEIKHMINKIMTEENDRIIKNKNTLKFYRDKIIIEKTKNQGTMILDKEIINQSSYIQKYIKELEDFFIALCGPSGYLNRMSLTSFIKAMKHFNIILNNKKKDIKNKKKIKKSMSSLNLNLNFDDLNMKDLYFLSHKYSFSYIKSSKKTQDKNNNTTKVNNLNIIKNNQNNNTFNKSNKYLSCSKGKKAKNKVSENLFNIFLGSNDNINNSNNSLNKKKSRCETDLIGIKEKKYDMLSDDDEQYLTESELSIIFAYLTVPKNINKNKKEIKLYNKKKLGNYYDTKLFTTETYLNSYSSYNKTESNVTNKLNFYQFLLSFELIAQKLYPYEDNLMISLDNLLIEKIIPNLNIKNKNNYYFDIIKDNKNNLCLNIHSNSDSEEVNDIDENNIN